MKKYLPIGVVVVVVLGGGFFAYRALSNRPSVVEEEEEAPDLPFDQRPFTKLVPRPDGHYLDLFVEDVDVPGAVSMDYELIYTTAAGITQGVPGIVKLKGNDSVERELLLGSESSGKFRYDEGVEIGMLTLKFRNEDGKLIGKVRTNWHLQKAPVSELTDVDGTFTYTLDAETDVNFVTMNAFGLPAPAASTVVYGPIGVYPSEEGPFSGTIEMAGSNVERWDGEEWASVSGSSDDIGVFVSGN